ncbi:hypothetical protein DINM_000747 [Dirofilaria immitis]|nr:hypothetical protein [Dirofilaria immitis]
MKRAYCVAYALIIIIKGVLEAVLNISVGAVVSNGNTRAFIGRTCKYTDIGVYCTHTIYKHTHKILTTTTMTATVVDQPDKQQHQQQDQEHTSKQHLPQQAQAKNDDIIVASMEGTDDEVGVAVSHDIPIDACYQAITEQDSTKQQNNSGKIPDVGNLIASASHAKMKKP